MPRQTVEKIIFGDYVLTMEAERPVISDGAVAIDEGEIIAVGSAHDIWYKYTTNLEIPGEDSVVLPGLINGHTHAGMTLLRGYSDDVPLIEWLNNHIDPIERVVVSEKFVRVGTELACWEMLRGGTTTFVDMYFFHEAAATVVDNVEMRALISATVVDKPRNDARSIAEQWGQCQSFVEGWSTASRSSTVKAILGGHAIYTLKREHLIELRQMSGEFTSPIHIHLAESEFESSFAQTNFGMTPIHFLDSIDFFDSHVIAAHVVWTTTEDIDVLARKKVGVIHNPTSNTKIASGVAPVTQYLEAGISVGLGTDGAATNNDLDLWEEMRLAAYLQKVSTMDPTVLPARSVLEMATKKGAEAIGMGKEIGSLREGKHADVIQVGINNAHQLPMYDVESHLVYATHASDVRRVFVNGKCLYHEGEFPTIDTEKLRKRVELLSNEIHIQRRQLH